MQTWAEWKKTNQIKLQHIAGFEEKFVDNVLSKIDLITPNDVTPQYHFIDRKNGNRYIDFMITISNGEKKFLLPIELDGKTKFDTYQSFNDTLERQNDLIKTFGFLLRYSNKKMLENPQEIIDEITQFIRSTLNRQDTAKLKQQNFEQYKQSVEAQVNALSHQVQYLKQEKQANIEQEINTLLERKFTEQSKMLGIAQLEQQIQALSGQINQLQRPIKSHAYLPFLFLLGILAAVLLGGWLYFSQETRNNISESKINTELSAKEASLSHLKLTISPTEAKNYVGKIETVCGYIAEIQPFSKGVYLNFEKHYPNQPITLVIWDKEIQQIGANSLKATEGQQYCIKGTIQNYKNKLQMILENPAYFYPLNEK